MDYFAKLATVSTVWCALRTVGRPRLDLSADTENLLALGLGGAAGWAWMALDKGRASAGLQGLGAGLACLLAGRYLDGIEANTVAARITVARRGR